VVGVVLFSLGVSFAVDTRSLRFSGNYHDDDEDAAVTSLLHASAVVACLLGIVIFADSGLGWYAAYQRDRRCLFIVRSHTYSSLFIMARVNEESYNLTCHSHVYPQMELAINGP